MTRTTKRSWVKIQYMHGAVFVTFKVIIKGRINHKHRGYHPTPASLQRLMRHLVRYC